MEISIKIFVSNYVKSYRIIETKKSQVIIPQPVKVRYSKNYLNIVIIITIINNYNLR
jgi:hypothetical protein